MKEAKTLETPKAHEHNLLEGESRDTKVQPLFQELIESLLYLSNNSRPDICFTVNKLSQYISKVNSHHFNAAKRVLRYLNGTEAYKLKYHKGERELKVTCYTDSDFAGDILTRKNTSGCVLTINNTPVAWFSRKQKCIAVHAKQNLLHAVRQRKSVCG